MPFKSNKYEKSIGAFLRQQGDYIAHAQNPNTYRHIERVHPEDRSPVSASAQEDDTKTTKVGPIDVEALVYGDIDTFTCAVYDYANELAEEWNQHIIDTAHQHSKAIVLGPHEEMNWDQVMNHLEVSDAWNIIDNKVVAPIFMPSTLDAEKLGELTEEQTLRWNSIIKKKQDEYDATRRHRRIS